jgi:Ran GTPase-activating protein (RanGAP) involved in mRNA processing and transport
LILFIEGDSMAASTDDTQKQTQKDLKTVKDNSGQASAVSTASFAANASQSFSSRPEVRNEMISQIRKGTLELPLAGAFNKDINLFDTELANLLQENYPLKEIILYISRIAPEQFSRFFTMLPYNKHIQILSLFQASYTKEEISSFMTHLIKGLSGEGIEPSNSNLTTLDIRGCHLNCSGAELLAVFLVNNTSLTAVSLRNNPIEGKGLVAICSALHHNKTIRSLDVSDITAEIEGLNAIGNLLKLNNTLTDLNLSDIGGDSHSDNAHGLFTEAQHITNLAEGLGYHRTPLTSLNLGFNTCSKEAILLLSASLQSHPTIQKIIVDRTYPAYGFAFKEIYEPKITGISSVITHFSHIPSLTILDCSHNYLMLEGAQSLKMGLKNNTTITKLNCCANQFKEEAGKEIAEILECNPLLNELDLSKNPIGPAGFKYLASALGKNKSLLRLFLGSCNLSSGSVHPLIPALTVPIRTQNLQASKNEFDSCPLQTLDLSSNRLGPQDAKDLAEILNSNGSLTSLGLNNNDRLNKDGIEALCTALHTGKTSPSNNTKATGHTTTQIKINPKTHQSNNQLSVLSLSGLGYGNTYANYFAMLIHNNTSLEHLRLPDQRFDEDGINLIAIAIQQNKTMTAIDLINHNNPSTNEPESKKKLYAEIAARCEANRIKRATLQSNWGRACTLISFSRAHQHLPSIQASILPLLPTIQAFADFDEGVPKTKLKNPVTAK